VAANLALEVGKVTPFCGRAFDRMPPGPQRPPGAPASGDCATVSGHSLIGTNSITCDSQQFEIRPAQFFALFHVRKTFQCPAAGNGIPTGACLSGLSGARFERAPCSPWASYRELPDSHGASRILTPPQALCGGANGGVSCRWLRGTATA